MNLEATMSIQSVQSQNFVIQFDDTKFTAAQIPPVQARAQFLLTSCEADLSTLCGWFGVNAAQKFGPNNPVVVTLTTDVRGAVNFGYSTKRSQMSVNPELGSANDFVALLFADEMSEILMSVIGGWQSNDSTGEGLSRVSGQLLHSASAPINVNGWLFVDPTQDKTAAVADDVFRKDWISQNFHGGPLKAGGNVAGDQDAYSVGCAMLFLFYLKDQLDFPIEQIAQTMPKAKKIDGTLDQLYKQLTHATVAAYPQFRRFVDVALPQGHAQLTVNDPFPLPLTNVAPSAVGQKDDLLVFLPMTDGRVIYTEAAPGKAFIGWQDVPGGGSTSTTLASAIIGNEIYLFARQQNGTIVFNKGPLKGPFGNWQVVPGEMLTPVAPAAAGRPSEVFLFATLPDGAVMYNQISPAGAFVGWLEVPGGFRANGAVAAGMQNQTLVVFANSSNGGVWYNQAAPGGAFVGWQEMPGAPVTKLPPSAAGRVGNLFVFLVGTDGKIYFNQAAPGGAFVGWQEMPGARTTSVGVAAAMQNQTLFVFARIADGRVVFNQADPGGTFVGWQLLR
jgi:hypothetical protein